MEYGSQDPDDPDTFPPEGSEISGTPPYLEVGDLRISHSFRPLSEQSPVAEV